MLLLVLSLSVKSPSVASGRIASFNAIRAQLETQRVPSRGNVHRAIELATDYLERACSADGKFVYLVDVGSGREISSYNVLRHSGAIYALAMANQLSADKKAGESMIRAAAFLRQNYIGPGPQAGQLAVWSKPLSRGLDGQFAELGGTGLGLVALAAVRKADPKAVPLRDLQALGRFILFLQQDDGSFVHKYLAKTGRVANWQSLYYPGEAALGLIALYEEDHSREWLEAAIKALIYLANSRAGLATVPADHWALIATAKLLPYCDTTTCTPLRERLIRHAAQICSSVLREQVRGTSGTGADGAFDLTGRTAPAATRLEGLVAALQFLPKGELREKIMEAIPRSIAFLLRAQVTSGPYSGGMPGSALAADSRIRIDYVQHALCAWIMYWQYSEILKNCTNTTEQCR